MKTFVASSSNLINCIHGDYSFSFKLPDNFDSLKTVYLALDADGAVIVYEQMPYDNFVNGNDKDFWNTRGNYHIVGNLRNDEFENGKYPFKKSQIIELHQREMYNKVHVLKDY